jgi:hypothetical protein
VGGDPDLICDYCHHEEEIESKRPEDNEFGAFEVTARDRMLFGFDELVVFQGREDPGLVGECGVWFVVFHHKFGYPRRIPAGAKASANSGGLTRR